MIVDSTADVVATAMAGRRRILILNWRDISHPRAGGAEKVTHEIARRWAQWGHHVTQFSALYPGAASEEEIDGVRILRAGRQDTVHWEAFRGYRRRLLGCCDVIVDEVNTIPFFAPMYAREPVVMFCHQLAREVWHYEAPFPLSVVGFVAEPLYLRAYRTTPFLTVSESTRNDLRRLGLKGPGFIVRNAIDLPAATRLPALDSKERDLTLVFVGRVVPSKRVDHIIRALSHLHRRGYAQARLWIVGAWDDRYKRALDKLIAEHALGESVIFWGRVEEATKERCLARAHVVVMTSVREGWGLAVSEANAVGTPGVVYDVPGLRDSTLHAQTGIVCTRNDPESLATSILALCGNRDYYARLRYAAWTMARQLTWDRTATQAWSAVQEAMSVAR